MLAFSSKMQKLLDFCGEHKQREMITYITILVTEDLPQVFVKQNGELVFNEAVKSVDDLKIFLEERLYKYFEA